ncbi:MAG: GNAT family N-acetyltransferase [Planctomycetes bacterium]|nr:GNAT family N-acetyltransferase [Planctomycetota bacterium]
MPDLDDLLIRDYRPGDEIGIVGLLNDVFGEDDPGYTPRTLEQWAWIYRDNPAGHQIVVAEEPGGRIAGHYACIPYRVVVDGRTATCGQGVDSMVRAEYRRGLKSEGLFLRTARRYFDTWGVPERNAYGYGFPNKKAFRIGVRMLGYTPVHAPVRTLGRNLFAKSDDVEVEVGGDPAGEIVALPRFDARADRLWERLGVAMGTVRDAAFLNWRYADCPFARYTSFGLAAADGELRGLCVLRDDWTGPPIQAVTECLVAGDDPGAAVRLWAHAVRRARDVGQQRVEMWLPPWSPLFAVAEAHGFTAEDSPFNLCIKLYGSAPSIDWVQRRWYFGIGDTDVF